MARFRSCRLHIPCLLAVCVCAVFAGVSCGRKGDPTLRAYLKPTPVRELRAVYRDDCLVLKWTYPQPDRKEIKGFSIEKAGPVEAAAGDAVPYQGMGVSSGEETTFPDCDVPRGMTYRYRVYAESKKGVVSDASTELAVTLREVPQSPAGLSYDVKPDAIEISWQPIEGARYLVYKSSEQGKAPSSPLTRSPIGEPRFRDMAPVDRAAYYSVKAVFDGEITVEGRMSAELAVRPEALVPAVPHGLRLVPLPKGVQLFWDESPETWIQGYRVYRKRSSDSEFAAVGDTAVPAFRDDETLSVVTWYLVTARGPAKESGRSPSVEATPVEGP